jgi:hypothetical protein
MIHYPLINPELPNKSGGGLMTAIPAIDLPLEQFI